MECKVASTSFFYLHFLLYRKSLRVLTRILHLFVSSLHQASEAFFIRYEQDGSRVCERLLHEKRSTFRHLAANLSEDGGKDSKGAASINKRTDEITTQKDEDGELFMHHAR
jgi:hypothetical protein